MAMSNKYIEKNVEEGLEAAAKAEEVEQGQGVEGSMSGGHGEEEERKRRSGGRWLRLIMGGDILKDKFVLRQLPLLGLIVVYLLLIVGNRYRIEALSRERQAEEERLKFLREARIQVQKRYQQSVKISQIAEDLQGTGVGITAGPPYEIEK